ncbi:Yip1 family protein [Dethiobacter alkaliphilus]|uniref:Yip1 domain-containing protein n=1 Tax=Dethiobacter alkaliphilus AHT 1 TaxID=555088 RepID=C0GGG3_DETAL|nr:Yip1 family protein [Dethiobacter alkaliphilus]EEG77593.1 hypothetical protein DealDRAFT_1716 [Dethiobacter alkaliphilus AHT 1]
MFGFIDDFYDSLFKPSRGIARVVQERTVWHGLFIYLAVSLVASITSFVGAGTEEVFTGLTQYMDPETAAALMRAWPVLNLLSIIVFYPLLYFVWAAVLQFSSELLGGSGKGLQVATGLGYGQLPYLLVVPFGLITHYMAFIVPLVSLAAFVWSVVLKVEVLHAVHGFSRGRAALAYFLPALVLVAAIFIFLVLIGSILMPLLAEMFPM